MSMMQQPELERKSLKEKHQTIFVNFPSGILTETCSENYSPITPTP